MEHRPSWHLRGLRKGRRSQVLAATRMKKHRGRKRTTSQWSSTIRRKSCCRSVRNMIRGPPLRSRSSSRIPWNTTRWRILQQTRPIIGSSLLGMPPISWSARQRQQPRPSAMSPRMTIWVQTAQPTRIKTLHNRCLPSHHDHTLRERRRQ